MGRAIANGDGLKFYYKGKIEQLEVAVKDKQHNLRRLEAQRNELNTQGTQSGCLVLASALLIRRAAMQ